MEALSAALVDGDTADSSGGWGIETLGLARNDIGPAGVSALVHTLLTPVASAQSTKTPSALAPARRTSLFQLLDDIEPITSEEKSHGYWRRFPQLSLSGNEGALSPSRSLTFGGRAGGTPVAMLVELCEQNLTLTSLDLQDTGVDDEGAMVLAAMVTAGRSSVKELILDDNRAITGVGARALVLALGAKAKGEEGRGLVSAAGEEVEEVEEGGGADKSDGKVGAAPKLTSSSAAVAGASGCLDCLSLRGINIAVARIDKSNRRRKETRVVEPEPEITKTMLTSFYLKHDPTNIARVDEILADYDSVTLNAALENKYGEGPIEEEEEGEEGEEEEEEEEEEVVGVSEARDVLAAVGALLGEEEGCFYIDEQQVVLLPNDDGNDDDDDDDDDDYFDGDHGGQQAANLAAAMTKHAGRVSRASALALKESMQLTEQEIQELYDRNSDDDADGEGSDDDMSFLDVSGFTRECHLSFCVEHGAGCRAGAVLRLEY
jgi:hypothetical protein